MLVFQIHTLFEGYLKQKESMKLDFMLSLLGDHIYCKLFLATSF